MNEKCPPQAQALHTWSPAVGTVGGGFEAVALLKEVCYQGRAVRIYNLTHFSFAFSAFFSFMVWG